MWLMLVDAVHALPMYKNHKRYVADFMIKETPKISARELSIQLNIPLGEAFVLLDEIRRDNPRDITTATRSPKAANKSLLDFSN